MIYTPSNKDMRNLASHVLDCIGRNGSCRGITFRGMPVHIYDDKMSMRYDILCGGKKCSVSYAAAFDIVCDWKGKVNEYPDLPVIKNPYGGDLYPPKSKPKVRITLCSETLWK